MHATRTLMDEHQTILRALASLEELLTNEMHRGEPMGTFAEIVDFLRHYADAFHHGKEEALLFPAMEAHGLPASHGPTAVMRAEHDEGRALVRRMARICEASDGRWESLREPGLEFVHLLRTHIGKEDQILFPMAERLLSSDDMDHLAAEYGIAESRDFALDTRARYDAWARELAGRLGVDAERYVAMPACHG